MQSQQSLEPPHVQPRGAIGLYCNHKKKELEFMPDDITVEPDPEILESAENLVRDRFRYADMEHPAIKTLFEIGIEKMARDMANNPKPYAEEEKQRQMLIDRPLEKQNSKLAPLELFVKEINLPALPQILLELLRVMNDPKSSATDLAKIIALDASLSSVILRMVNSAYYNFPFAIDTIDRAVTLLGIQELTALAFSTSFLKMFKRSSSAFINLEQFWKHSIACGIITRELAKRCKKQNPERHFLAGLLHDIGRLALYSNIPESAGVALAIMFQKDIMLGEAEQTVFGFDHARFGGALMNKWSFPSTLVTAVLNHHTPDMNEGFDEPLTVHLADIIANALGMSTSSQFPLMPLNSKTWDALGLSPEALNPMMIELEPVIDSTFSIFIGSKG
jgi:putative nucleotidyltransferase with HDIG domain